MVCQPLRLALLIGAITAVAVSPVRANNGASDCCGSSGTTAPAYRTVTCTEWVRENVVTKRTAYKVECRTEQYDTCRIECVPECREHVVCVKKRVPVMTEQCRKVCHKVTVWEERMVNKTSHKFVQETCIKKTLVRHGHWECKEVPAMFSGFGGLFSGHGHSCGSSCDTGCSTGCNDACSTPCKTRTVKHWVHCPEYKECPVTVCKKVCVTECVACKVAVCKNEWREEKVKVCTYQCIEEKQVVKSTVYVKHSVPCKATRTVRVCVPYEECVTVCKMVPRTVTRQVPCAPVCTTACNTCNDSCSSEGFFSRMRGRLRHNSDCCRESCSSCSK